MSPHPLTEATSISDNQTRPSIIEWLQKALSFLLANEWLTLLLLCVVTLLLRLVNITHTSLWLDEIHSLMVVNLHPYPHTLDGSIQTAQSFFNDYLAWQPMNYEKLIEALKINVHLPLYYLLLNPWLEQFGNDSFGLRSFSALWSTLMLLPLYALGKSMGGRTLGLLTVFCFIISPNQIYYAQEGRMYTLNLFMSVTATLALWKILFTPNHTFRWMLLYTLSVMGALTTHYMSVFFMVFHFVMGFIFLVKKPEKKLLWFLMPTVSVLAFLAYWYPIYEAQHNGINQDYHFAKGLEDWLQYVGVLGWQPLTMITGSNILARVFYIPVTVGLILLYFATNASKKIKLTIANEIFVAAWLFIPLLMQILYDFISQTHTSLIDRYVVLTSPATVLLLALGLQRLSQFRFGNLIAGVLMIGMTVIGVGAVFAKSPFRDEHNKKNFTRRFTYLSSQLQSKDLVMVSGPFGSAALAAYYLVKTGSPKQPMLYWSKSHLSRYYSLPETELLKPYKRVWLFKLRSTDERGREDLKQLLSKEFPIQDNLLHQSWPIYSRK